MKRIFLAVLVFTFASSLCLAEEASAPSIADNSSNQTQASGNATAPEQVPSATVASTGATLLAPAGTTTLIGKVNDIHSVSSGSGANSQITVKDDHGQGTSFTVASGATITDRDGNATTLNWISQGNKIAIKYTTAQDGTKTAQSIKLLAN